MPDLVLHPAPVNATSRRPPSSRCSAASEASSAGVIPGEGESEDLSNTHPSLAFVVHGGDVMALTTAS